MSRSKVRSFLPALLCLVLVATALLALTLPEKEGAISTVRLAGGIPRMLPAAFVVSAPAPATATEPAKTKAVATTIEPAQSVNSRMHTARAGETVTSVARLYLPETPYMGTKELAEAIRRANPGLKGEFLKAGQQITVPDIEPQPVVEHSRPWAKDTEVRAIYLTGTMAGSDTGLSIIRHWKEVGGNAIVFDVKDSDGSVNIPFEHPLAPKGYHLPLRNLPKFVRWAHKLDLHVIARIAIFRDELLVRHHPELAVQSRRSGTAWRENGKLVWTDTSHLEVQDYNIALARTAAAGGVDEVQYDYVRFPAEGDQADAKFQFQSVPGRTRADVIEDFLARSQKALAPSGVLFSLDVFGVMAWQRPVDLGHTGQDIVRMAKHCDVLSPMIYPSHFFGMDGYDKPGDAPEHFIGESMERFRKI
ncbi:MAG TPA: putative glycoside hydrolase, partial [Terriglobales bacterium]|nr:putative glycoside hydrolase [Terriglobales bacterium]